MAHVYTGVHPETSSLPNGWRTGKHARGRVVYEPDDDMIHVGSTALPNLPLGRVTLSLG